MVHLILGYGEVGMALHKIFPQAMWMDRKGGNWNQERVQVLHVSIPYSEEFKEIIEGWKDKVDMIIVHSTVPVGTCDELGVVHSPIRGVHPELESGIRTFVKYFGGEGAEKAAELFRKVGIRTRSYPEAKITEALKLWDTTQYGMLILLQKTIYKWCKKRGLPFDIVYQQANIDYNEGYLKLGRPDVVRPFLKHMEGPIGGHCIIPNSKLLGVELPVDVPDEE